MKNKITEHANERFYERTNQEVTRKMIVNHLSNGGEIHYAKRMTATRSLAYVPIKDEVFKIIINRRSKKIVSILPFRDTFKRDIIFYNEHYNNKTYHVELYPDCYSETDSIHTMTKIYTLDDNNEKNTEIPFNHPFFSGLFYIALTIHKKVKGNYNENSIETKTDEVIKETNSY